MSHRSLTALPVYNEAAHIADVLAQVCQFAEEILVVDDGSTDATGKLLCARRDIRVITHETNLGYGAALRSSFEYAQHGNFDSLVTIDCDGQHEPRLIPDLQAALDPEAGPPVDIVSGSRYLREFAENSLPPEERRGINLTITQMLNERLGLSLTDAFCGFKAYRVESLLHLNITELGYAMPLQLWIQAVAAELRITEFAVPLVYLEEERSFGGSLDDGRQRMAYYEEVIERELSRLPGRSTTV